jgi:hypothetical protein
MEQAVRDIALGSGNAYHGKPPKDRYEAIALGILRNLCDRRGIKWELGAVDGDVREDIVETMTAIIKAGVDTDIPLFEDYDAAYDWVKSQEPTQ